jgi:O-antigen/teichoic acid export membrane protein
MYKFIKKSDFISKIILLVSGTLIAQSISYLLSPVISRLYTPEEMSYLTLFIKIVSFLAVISTARYEIAFPIPKRDEHAFSLYRKSFFFIKIIVLLSVIAVLLFDVFEIQKIYLESILYFIPIGIFLVAFNSQGLNWAIRMEDYKSINTSKILQSSANSIFCVLFGFLSFGEYGLLISFVISLILSNIPYWRVFSRTKKMMYSFKLKGRDFAILKSYSDFPFINLPHVMMDLTKELFIALFLIYYFDKEVLGLYDFSYRMLRLPIAIIGASLSQVLFKKVVDLINDKQPIYRLVRKTVVVLFLISVLPFGILFFYGSEIFGFVFGDNWREAGVYSEIMAPWLMMNFIVSPLSQIPTVLNKQKTFFILSFISTLILVFVFLLNQLIPSVNFIYMLRVLSISQFFCLIFVLFWILRISKKTMSKI